MPSDERGTTDATERFFDDLRHRGYEPLVAKFSGRLRFDLVDGGRTDHWLVAIDKGQVAVSHEGGDADCTIKTDKAMFDTLASGEANAMAAALRGALVCTGDVDLLLAIQRIFPGPPPAGARVGRS